MRLIDAHTHVQFAAFNKDREAAIERARAAGVSMLNVGTQRDTSMQALELAKKYEHSMWASVGLHPVHTEKSYHDIKELGATNGESGFTSRGEEFDYGFYKSLAVQPQVLAIGECGLDYFRLSDDTKARQRAVLESQIQLAREVRKPLMIHCRNAFDDLIILLMSVSANLNVPPGAIHFFTGTKEDARQLLDLGFVFTFGGVTTFARNYDETIRYLPLDHILLETDAPYVTPEPYRGKRNEPAYVVEVCKKIAEIKNIEVEEVAAITTQNFLRVFKPPESQVPNSK